MESQAWDPPPRGPEHQGVGAALGRCWGRWGVLGLLLGGSLHGVGSTVRFNMLHVFILTVASFTSWSIEAFHLFHSSFYSVGGFFYVKDGMNVWMASLCLSYLYFMYPFIYLFTQFYLFCTLSASTYLFLILLACFCYVFVFLCLRIFLIKRHPAFFTH